MDAHHFQLMIPGIGDRGLPAVRHHDRRAVGGMQGKQLPPWRQLRGLRKECSDVFGPDGLDVGDFAAAEPRQRLGGGSVWNDTIFHVSHGARHLFSVEPGGFVTVGDADAS